MSGPNPLGSLTAAERTADHSFHMTNSGLPMPPDHWCPSTYRRQGICGRLRDWVPRSSQALL